MDLKSKLKFISDNINRLSRDKLKDLCSYIYILKDDSISPIKKGNVESISIDTNKLNPDIIDYIYDTLKESFSY